MTYRPIPEERRRELAAFIPDLAEERRRTPCIGRTAERDFWTDRILSIQKRSPAFPTSAAERLWLIRHAHLAVTGADPIRVVERLVALSGQPVARPDPDADEPATGHRSILRPRSPAAA